LRSVAPGRMTTPTTPETPTEPKPLTRLQTQKYMNKHFPQTPRQLREHVERVLKSWKTMEIVPTDEFLWEWFQARFRLWSPYDFKNLGTDSQKELRRYLRCGGVFVRPDDKSIAQALHETANEDKQHVWTNEDILKCIEDLKKGPVTSVWIATSPTPHDWRLPLPFASFAQEAIPLHLQARELPEERRERLYQEQLRQQKKAQEHQEQEQRQEQRLLKKQEQQLLKDLKKQEQQREQQLLKYRPQPSDCRHCKEHFDSKNTLFRHLEHCKPRSRASSVTSQSSTSSRASSVSSSRASSVSSTPSTSSTAMTASIEKVQLQVLRQLYTIRSASPPQTSTNLHEPPTPPYEFPTTSYTINTKNTTPQSVLTTARVPIVLSGELGLQQVKNQLIRGSYSALIY
jgi:hypothetical protein